VGFTGLAGAPVKGRGVVAADAGDGPLRPTLLLAVTVNVYACRSVSPVTMQEVFPSVASQNLLASSTALAVYLRSAVPPVIVEAGQETTTAVPRASVDTAVGAEGAPIGVTAPELSEAGDVPALLVAFTVKV
jgi:hypothetical protein